MAANAEAPLPLRAWPWWRWVLMGLILLGLTLSGYLSWHHLQGGAALGCGVGSACDEVLSSRWATIGGVLPVSGMAAGAYLAMLIASLYIGPTVEASLRRLAFGALLVLAGAAAGSAVWFTIVQKWIVRAFCPWCMAAHTTGLLLATFVVWRTYVERKTTLSPWSAFARLLIGLVLAGGMAACQYTIVPPPVYQEGVVSKKEVPVADPQAVPLVGSPDAPHVVTLFFDYQCTHCQQIHFMLPEVIRQFDGQVAFELCPTPLSPQCNPFISRDVEAFKDSCELARIGLAVWLAKPEAFPGFELWMFTFDSGDRWQPRELDAARAKAIELVGQAEFDAAVADPWVEEYLETSVQKFGETIPDDQTGTGIPKMAFGSRWVIPQPNTPDDLVTILRDVLAVPGSPSEPSTL